ncbi:type II toxin-antitoxin system Phd/YefM family antitoxin [Pseudomonas carassii]|uniref:Antitoxin n=1 Tax=Pseudomonas carassii TaxID=3115855 RepID=A0ABU7HEN3_9PSED|nr:antitoxin [Pseudomonas sp. 137P]MEE1889785.1 antitoxin [Pseudomonas sp. 137P]
MHGWGGQGQRVFRILCRPVSELNKNPTAVMADAQGKPVAVLNHNRVMGYRVPAELYEAMMERQEEIELVALVKARAGEKGIPVELDDL